MKHQTLAGFDREFRRLPVKRQLQFMATVRRLIRDADAGASSPVRSGRTCAHRLAGREVYSLRWAPDTPEGRATFHIRQDEAGQPSLVWRRIGDHSIYKDP
ncbi:hypothetical protein FZ103_13715 [Streptomonospora sp. PA3]|uniref:hypothetical protein n=1 Tax=Streptomonospora sp. PA3 TaxID=2607326 RepID=UPI0012DDF067|nr:hypothetical protein [Streptomonospora sp. PA3]MUL42225.1 hypothetical protein [Streptomonospora sp. PA3]